MRVAGLMSGTSADGVDGVLLSLGPGTAGTAELLSHHHVPFPDDVRGWILDAAEGRMPLEALLRLRGELTTAYAACAASLFDEAGTDPSGVTALGCHGQTLWHTPPTGGTPGQSLQWLDPAGVAAATGVPVVSDFRAADLAAGGQGAPLVPWADRILVPPGPEAVAVQNLGGMGNVTWLPRAGSPDPMLAFDTGPANALMDAAAEMASAGRVRFDRDGALAARGTADPDLLEQLLAHPFFDEAPPRSTGREVFGRPLVERLARERGLEAGLEDGWPDLVATLLEVTVRSVARAYDRWLVPRGLDRVLLTGGGSRNPLLVDRLSQALTPRPVDVATGLLGPRIHEAAAFALLAWAFVSGRPANLPSCTGAAGPRILGSWTPAPGRTVWSAG